MHEEIAGYWRQVSRQRRLWLQDTWIDHALVVLPRAEAVLTTGDLITNGRKEAQARPADPARALAACRTKCSGQTMEFRTRQ